MSAATTTAVSVVVLDASGAASARLAVAEEIATQEIKPHLIHETVVAELAWLRSGSAKTKTRSEVRGGGRKPWRQKGTGRARQGSIRAPQWTGGGIVFGPTPRSYGGKVNRKARRQALLGALRAHLERGSVALMDELGWDGASTKRAAAYLAAAPERLGDRALAVIVSEPEGPEARSFRNLRDVDVVPAAEVTTAHLMSYRSVLVQRAAWERLWGDLGSAEQLTGGSGPTAGEAAAAREASKRSARAERVEARRAVAAERAARRAAEAPAEEPAAEAEAEVAEEAPAPKKPARRTAAKKKAEPEATAETEATAEAEDAPETTGEAGEPAADREDEATAEAPAEEAEEAPAADEDGTGEGDDDEEASA